jgi:TRAP transporter TAXI family solute receptor
MRRSAFLASRGRGSRKWGCMSARHFLQSNWQSIAIAVTVAAVACAFLVIWLSMPPHAIVMATGPEGGTYYELGERYRTVLARSGVEVRLVPTAGSVENLAKLLDPRSGVSLALMQGGIAGTGAASELESLGTMFYEPYWWFRRVDVEGVGVASLRGRKISIGPEGSGTRALSLKLLTSVGIDGRNSELLALAPRETAERLSAGDIDVAFLIASWDSPVVRELIADSRIALSGYPRADALVALNPFLSKLTVPRGAANLVKDQPPSDVVLIGTKASLLVRKDLHPAIQYLLLNAATEIHSQASIFNRANDFPAAEAIDVPLSSEALRFYKSGLPFLHEYFPFWMAELVGKLVILLIPILGVLYPVMHFLPRIYDWAMRSKVLRVYGELRVLEDATSRVQSNKRNMREMIAQLDRMEEQVNHLTVPNTYASMLYELRTHIDLVRERLKKNADNVVE